MNATIKVTKRFENQTKSDPPKTWWSIYAGSEKYSIWDKAVADVLQEGVEATVDFYTKNGYHTISAIVGADVVPTQEDILKLVSEEIAQPEPMMKVSDAYPTQPSQHIAPRKELPEVVVVISERIAAYSVAAQLISAGNGEYKDIERMADSALAYYYAQPKPKSVAVPETANLNDYLRKD